MIFVVCMPLLDTPLSPVQSLGTLTSTQSASSVPPIFPLKNLPVE